MTVKKVIVPPITNDPEEVRRFFENVCNVFNELYGLTDATKDIQYSTGEFKIGNISAGNYLSIEADGTIVFNGDATVWDDLRVPALSTTAGGSNPPTFAQFKNDGSTGTGNALQFDSSNDEYIQIPSSALLNFDSAAATKTFSIGFLIKIESGFSAGHIVTKSGNKWRIELLANGKLRVRTDSGVRIISDNPLNIGSVNAVVVTVSATTSDHTVEVFINGVSQGTDFENDPLDDSTAVIYIGSRNGSTSYPDIQLDELRIWDSVLSPSEIATFYNNGAGAEASIATEICGYHFNEGTGTDCDNFEGTAALDIDMTSSTDDPEWIVGFISSGTRGVFTYFFDPDNEQELYFTAQFPHARKTATDIHPHVHWVPKTTGGVGEMVKWGIEYVWQDINGIYSDASIVYGTNPVGGATTMVADTHYMTNLTVMDGSGISLVSSMLVGRLFRDTADAEDDYPYDAGLLEIDFHFEMDTFGSREEAAK